jgi:hypothetical protein
MTTVPTSQLTLNWEPSLADRHPSLRAYIAHRINLQSKPAKTIAADMDIAPSTLSRKLHPSPEDSARFNTDDLEKYLAATGDVAAVIEYLAAKFMAGGDEARKARAISRVELLAVELEKAIREVKG